jgi:MoaA/NifB/PqqE/SkfB family radical SAM enzyme
MIELSIDVTYECPFSCPFCSSPQNLLLPDMKLGTASRSLDFAHEISKNDVIVVTITGGEPLTLDSLPLLISTWARDNNVIRLCTTAAFSVEKNYWHNLRSQGLQSIHLSLHSIPGKNYKNIFGEKYKFAVVDKNVEWVMAAGIEIYVNFVLTSVNVNSFDEVLDYCINKGIKKIRILGLAKQGKAIKNWGKLTLFGEEEGFIKHALEIARSHPVKLEFAGLPNHRRCTHTDDNGKCLGGKRFFHINTNGDIYPCPSVKSVGAEKIGSIFHPQRISVTDRFPCEATRSSIRI